MYKTYTLFVSRKGFRVQPIKKGLDALHQGLSYRHSGEKVEGLMTPRRNLD